MIVMRNSELSFLKKLVMNLTLPIKEIDFMVFYKRRERDLSVAFYLIKNIDLSQGYRWSKVSACV